MSDKYLKWHDHSVDQQMHARQKGQQPGLLWFTGLSGAGKSTIANALALELYQRGKHIYLLDGDNVRLGLNRDLGFTDEDRVENIRRIGEVARLMVDAGLIVLSAFISPFHADRALVKQRLPEKQFFEIYIKAPLSACESRDPKGLYRKARSGELKRFTGIDSPYEAPSSPDLVLDTTTLGVSECVDALVKFMTEKGLISERVGLSCDS